ncbi:MAG: type III pantothenate kinase [Oscillospiraceae bacterium]
MTLCIDIGNTNIVLGCYEGTSLCFYSRISTDRSRLADQYAVEFLNILRLHDMNIQKIDGAIVGSVVPELTDAVCCAVHTVVKIKPMILSESLRTGLCIKIDSPSQLGSDLIAAAVAVKAKYPLPAIIIDMGTATTISVLAKNGDFLGGSIMPGVRIATDALIARTSMLVGISFEAPPSPIGKNTVDSMKSGAVLGTAAMLDGMCGLIADELGSMPFVVATGGLAEVITPHCKTEIVNDDLLLMEGLLQVFNINNNQF